jgi:hypothetical protein
MTALDLSKAHWRKSTRSGTNGNCVEVATNLVDTENVVLVRDSKAPTDGVLDAALDHRPSNPPSRRTDLRCHYRSLPLTRSTRAPRRHGPQ